MSKTYLDSLNIGMTICNRYNEKDGKVTNIYGMKDEIKLDSNSRVSFCLICDYNFIEFEVSENEKQLSFRFFVRALDGKLKYIIPL